MYDYADFDRAFVQGRVAEFRDQVERRIAGSLTEEEFLPLRLRNGLYLQLHAYMYRIAIPYGTLNSRKLRQLAMISERWDRGYGHFTTRTNIQFNWPKLRDVPDMMAALAEVGMHSIQTSGNCVRNVTADHFAGAAADEIEDPRATAELLRQWSTDHPEFAWLPRKFKIGITAAPHDRAATKTHDIALRIVRDAEGAVGYEVSVGGGLGRTPMIAKTVREFLPKAELLPYIEAILEVYNLAGRRDNKHKARLKILVHEIGIDEVRARVEAVFEERLAAFRGVNPGLLAEIEAAFAPPAFVALPTEDYARAHAEDPVFRSWVDVNCVAHRRDDYAIATISLKPIGGTPGDATAAQMRLVADLAEAYAHDEVRVSHEQNLVLPHVPRAHLPAVHAALREAGLATANVGLVSDIIACPGMDYCSLATARSIPIAQQIAETFADLDAQRDIGPLKIKVSGCINACGHHHVGHIGILGLDRAGVENYQITLGGDAAEAAAIGERAGPGFAYDEIVPAVERLIEAYLDHRLEPGESFLEAYRRLGAAPFKAALYPPEERSDAA
ncbi:MAG TPA: nitrite/sulfite reductase [Amaricoccus sp.]|uniref:nitrite/sulfite reductase n=1 Tax=Amaricoccus sp. TaxID=1872485 RepID=UPI002BE8B3B2|nr:nitrite/sulfite reductase [Amaricoccus sp.]HMQ92369.1 nitrite/sulfite reductase [Amaricoccus sp.]HMR51623.1 nitrite/sulfite reductase [Amaricoccus sp.]HMR60157.1 nitrite/sulfite reductase [Amaricoccus sp.]HMT98441.1 nitrite/sulfite reductase [Amaricoccus sp.]